MINVTLFFRETYLVFLLVVLSVLMPLNVAAQFTEVGHSIQTNGHVQWIDYDCDGDLDLLAGGSLFNNSQGAFSATGISFPEDEGQWIDFDLDGFPDFVLNRNQTYVFLNRGSYFQEMLLNLPLPESHTMLRSVMGDFDNDSDQDIAVLTNRNDELWPYGNGGYLLIFDNDNGVYTQSNSFSGMASEGLLTTMDADNDGVLDFFITGYYDIFTTFFQIPNTRQFISSAILNLNTTPGLRIIQDLVMGETITSYSSALSNASVDWGDYNSDGKLELLISGYHEDWQSDYAMDHPPVPIMLNSYTYSAIFNYLEDFTPEVAFDGYDFPSMNWGDMNNDGSLDAVVSNHVYMNNNGNFFDQYVPIGVHGAYFSALGDYDNDGDLDVVMSTDLGIKIFRNEIPSLNLAPEPPLILISKSDIRPNSLRAVISSSTDDLSPSLGLSYNLRVGSSPGESDIVNPLANTTTGSLFTTNRGYNPLFQIAPGDTVYVSAQAVDNCFKGSLFSPEIQYISPPVHLLFPNGSETLVSGSTAYIQWSENNVYSLNAELTTNDGLNWINLNTSPFLSSPGLYYFTVPIANSNQCRIRLSWADNDEYFDLSNDVFSISSSSMLPRLSLIYPSATDLYLTPGQAADITWTSANVTAVNIDASYDNGSTWTVLTGNHPAVLSPYVWMVPDTITAQARIRLSSSTNPTFCDYSDNPFVITKITLFTPNGGEILTANYSGSQVVPISWSAPFVSSVKIAYSSTNGASWTTLPGNISGSLGVFNWQPPAIESNQCLIRVSHSSVSNISDISDDVFTIRVPAKFINVNGGGFVNNNCDFNIRWRIIDVPEDTQVFLEYSPNNQNWYRAHQDSIQVSVLSQTVFLNLGSATSVWFRMINSSSYFIIAKSSSSITITGKMLHIITPQTGQHLPIGSYSNITWTADGCTNLNILFTADYGETWLPVATGVPASNQSFVWQVPNMNSSQCRIKLQDNTYPYMNIESGGEFSIYPTEFMASFTATPTTGYSDLSVHFSDTSIGYIQTWSWDFQNDGIVDSQEQNPIWIYRQSGLYSVCLTISDGTTSASITRNNYVYVLPMQADFSASQTSGYLPLSLQFTDLTESDVTLWQWDFDSDGLIDSEAENPVWTYIFPGTYTVSHWVSNDLDSDSEIKESYITVSLDPAHTLYVPSQYLTIQAAIDASSNGDYIIIANGIYYENLLIEGKTITLASYYFIDGDSTHISNTVIDGSNALNPDQASTITILPGSGRPNTTPHISGFTIRGGSGRRVVQNQGDSIIEKRVGGGIYTRQANPIFSYNKIEDNDADDEGGGSYAFQSQPNHGGMVDPAIGLFNPGANYFANNHADIGSDIYIDGITQRDPIKLQNCSFAVISVSDTTVSNYWVNSSAAVSFSGSTGREAALSADLYVATDGSDTLNNGLSPASPFKTIDHALSRIYTTEGHPLTIHIASGSYSPSLTGEKFPLQMVKHVSLQGAGRDETFLDAEGSADFPRRVLNLDNVVGVNISSLTLMNGFVTTVKNYNGGGIGIINSNCSLSNLLLAGSASAGNGAGLYAFQSSVIADSISLQYNAALGSGGGICANASDLQISGANISHNSANKNGAGIFADGGLLSLSESEISNNQATGYQSKGGGLSLSNTSEALISNNRIQANNSDLGAGIYFQSNQNLRLDRNRINNNLADFNGGGLFVNTTTGLFTNNLISNNTATQRGGGLYCYSAPLISSNTIASNQAGNEGGGIYLNGASPVLTNNIVWGNVRSNPGTPSQLFLYAESSDPDISYCNIQGGRTDITLSPGTSYSGSYTNNQDTDPLFTYPSEGAGYHFVTGEAAFRLQTSSPCVDQGDPATDASDYPLDLAGYTRIVNNRVDIGSYETVHFDGAVITASASLINFGRVDVSGLPASSTLTIFNNGNQDLLITNISLESSDPDFNFQISDRNHLILPGSSLDLELIFAPTIGGERINKLLIHNNSLNSSIFSIDLVGTGIDAGTSYPSNVQLQIRGNDVQICWNPVISDPQGNPYTPSGYLVFGSEQANSSIEDYLLISYTELPEFIHRQVARVKNRMFYIIIAIDEDSRARIIPVMENQQLVDPLSWKEINNLIP